MGGQCYLPRKLHCLGISILYLRTTCLWGDSTISLGVMLATWGEVLAAWESPFSAWGLPACRGTLLYPWKIVLATAWGEAADCLENSAFSALGTTCLRGTSTREVTDGANNQATTCTQPTTNEVKTKGYIVIPYLHKVCCESIKKICGRYGIQTHFKGSRTIKNLLVSPKDKEPMVSKSGAIYWLAMWWPFLVMTEYIWETARTFGEKFKEHLKDPSPFIIIATLQATALVKITFK